MYLARKPFHRCLASFSLIIRNSMRLFATSVKLAEKRQEQYAERTDDPIEKHGDCGKGGAG